MSERDSETTSRLLEEIRNNQKLQLERQAESLDMQRRQLSLVEKQMERAEKIQDRAGELQETRFTHDVARPANPADYSACRDNPRAVHLLVVVFLVNPVAGIPFPEHQAHAGRLEEECK